METIYIQAKWVVAKEATRRNAACLAAKEIRRILAAHGDIWVSPRAYAEGTFSHVSWLNGDSHPSHYVWTYQTASAWLTDYEWHVEQKEV